MKQSVKNYLGSNIKYVEQEICNGAVIRLTEETLAIFGIIDSSQAVQDIGEEFLSNLKYYWFGESDDFENGIKKSKYWSDEVIYVLIPTEYVNSEFEDVTINQSDN